jgi:glyoxylase-like metal-dependent hydrolase (beta-lactamase superfamily II)
VARFPGRLLRFLTAPVPRGFVPNLFDFDGPAMLGFPRSWRVTSDGSILALPTPGHSPGHTSFLVRRSEGDVLLAGDVTYDLPALHDQREQGFIAKVEEHRQTLSRVLSLVQGGVAYLPSHDPESPARLRLKSGRMPDLRHERKVAIKFRRFPSRLPAPAPRDIFSGVDPLPDLLRVVRLDGALFDAIEAVA